MLKSEHHISEYDITTNPTAPRGHFKCAFCGASISRRLSKVKNPNLVFCDNTCRGKYKERESLKKSMYVGDDFKREVNDDEIKRIAHSAILRARHKFIAARKYTDDELWQECLLAIWKFGQKANDGNGDKYGFYKKAFDGVIMNFLHTMEWNVDEVYIDDESPIYEPQDSGMNIVGAILLKEIEDKAPKKKNWQWFREYYIGGKPSSEIAQEHGEDMRVVVCAISYIKKTLTKKYTTF